MGPETKKRAPGAENSKTKYLRPLAVIVLTASVAVVYNENQDVGNQGQDSESKAHRVLSAKELQALSGSFSIKDLTPSPKDVEVSPTAIPTTPEKTAPQKIQQEPTPVRVEALGVNPNLKPQDKTDRTDCAPL